MKKIVFAFSVLAALMMSACLPETRNEMLGIPEGAIQLSTENFVSNDTKTAVSGTSVVWVGGEDVDMYVGDEDSKQTRSVVVSEGNAYIASGLTGTGDIRGYYPSGLATANQNSNPTVVLPAEYSCSVSSGRQVIDLPMVGKAESGATSIKFKHLTAAVNVMLKNSLGSDLYVDSTIVIADEYNLNYAGGKTVIFSYSDLNISASTMGATDAKKRVKVYFPSAFTIPTGSSDKCIQVPIMPIGVDSLTIKVYCHSATTNYVYSHTASSPAIARNEMLTAKVDLRLSSNNNGHMEEVIVAENVIDLSNVTTSSSLNLVDGDVLTGTYSYSSNIQCKIAAGATVKLRNVNATGSKSIRLEALGNATIIVQGKNIIKCISGYPGLRVAPSYTLTIKDDPTNAVDDSLEVVSPSSSSAAIGSYNGVACGNIIINGGTIIATNTSSSNGAPGIGSGYTNYNCGDITINGGTVIATGGYRAAGIGTANRACVCGDITINGGTVVSTGGTSAAGIGTGYYYATCGSITINGGIVTATGGSGAAGIGTSAYSNLSNNKCGDITITVGVTRVTVTKGTGATASIGRGNANSTCGDITVMGEGGEKTDNYTYPTAK